MVSQQYQDNIDTLLKKIEEAETIVVGGAAVTVFLQEKNGGLILQLKSNLYMQGADWSRKLTHGEIC